MGRKPLQGIQFSVGQGFDGGDELLAGRGHDAAAALELQTGGAKPLPEVGVGLVSDADLEGVADCDPEAPVVGLAIEQHRAVQVEQPVTDELILLEIGHGFERQVAQVGLTLQQLFIDVGRSSGLSKLK